MAAGSQPLAFAELALGGLLLTSAITGETMGELLTNGLTEQGKARLHAKNSAGSSGGFGALPGEESGTPGVVSTGSLEPGHGAPVGSTAPPPGKVGSEVGKNAAPKTKNDYQHLRYGLERALETKHRLEGEWHSGHISKAQGERQFHTQFPWYADWTKELKAMIPK